MIVHNVDQGSSAWLRLRMGIPTASAFDSIITPKGKESAAQDTYLRELLAELVMGHPLAGPSMPWMDRGKALEQEAASFYEFQNEIETVRVGFITNDAKTMGASPDRLVGDKGLLEIKVPKPETHIGYLIFHDVSEKYKPQIQGQLYVAEREWLDIVSYHPEMPPAIVHCVRDEEYIKTLAKQLNQFSERLEALKGDLAERGLLHEPAVPREFLTDADVEAILESRR